MPSNLEKLHLRHSVRSYSDISIPESLRNYLRAEITQICTHEPGLHFQIFFDDPTPFQGFRKSYGFFKGVRNYLACVVDDHYPNTFERAGYFAQQIVMCAVEHGLGTCYVGGTFDRNSLSVVLRAGWTVPFVIAFGYPSEHRQSFIANAATRYIHRNDKQPKDFFEGENGELLKCMKEIPWLEMGLKGLACAPSALNKQPVRIYVNNGNIFAKVDETNPKNLIDLGIGMWNFGYAADGDWEFGNPAAFYPFGDNTD